MGTFVSIPRSPDFFGCYEFGSTTSTFERSVAAQEEFPEELIYSWHLVFNAKEAESMERMAANIAERHPGDYVRWQKAKFSALYSITKVLKVFKHKARILRIWLDAKGNVLRFHVDSYELHLDKRYSEEGAVWAEQAHPMSLLKGDMPTQPISIKEMHALREKYNIRWELAGEAQHTAEFLDIVANRKIAGKPADLHY